MRRRLWAWAPALLWAALIFALSSRPSLPLPGSGLDKLAHFGTYAVLGLFLGRGGAASSVPVVGIVLLGWLYGASDEVHQHFVPGRSPELLDWVADALGVAAGVASYQLLRRRFRRAHRDPEPLSSHTS